MRTSTKRVRRQSGHPDKTILADIVRRVIEVAEPLKIILFGSAARGEMGPDSDIDLLVIKAGEFNRWKLTTAIDRHLRGKGAAVDVLESHDVTTLIPRTHLRPLMRRALWSFRRRSRSESS